MGGGPDCVDHVLEVVDASAKLKGWEEGVVPAFVKRYLLPFGGMDCG